MKSSSNKKKGFGNSSRESCKEHPLEINYELIKEQEALDLFKKGKSKEAEEIYLKLIKLGTKNHKIYGNLAALNGMKGNKSEMYRLLIKAIEIEPNFSEAHNNLGSYYRKEGDLVNAILAFKKSIQLNPNYFDSYNNLGNAFRDQGDLVSSIDSYLQALAISPSNANIIFNLSFVQLLSGDFKSGWKNYEARLTKTDPVPIYGNPKCERFNEVDLSDISSLLIVCEQGLGDTIQFMRYLPYIKSNQLNISFSAQEKLHPLIKQSNIDLNPLTPEQASNVSEGCWIPLLSLPRYLKIDADSPLVTKPYIFTSDQLRHKWKNILSKEKKMIIGINWQGNPATERNNLKGRSLALELFSLIAEKDVRLVSLQKGFGSEQLKTCSFQEKFVESQDQINNIWDFDETVAMIDNCDLIITSDTVTAHLAGGMGKPTWLLLSVIPDWRWGLNSDKTFWYPSIRLFRQSVRNNWNEVMRRVSLELDDLLFQRDENG